MRGGTDRPVRGRKLAVAAIVSFGILGPPGIAAAASGAPGGAAPAPTTAAMVPLAGNTVAVPHGAVVLGPTAASTPITVDVALRPRDPVALNAFAQAVSTPGSPLYRHYLPAGHLATAFGPSAATLLATRHWLTAEGLHVGATSPDGLLVAATGTAGQLESAFSVPLVQTRLADGRVARLGTRNPVVPGALAPSLQGVVGLSSVATGTPHLVLDGPVRSSTAGPHVATPAQTPAHSPSCPSTEQQDAEDAGHPTWTATQLAATYGLTSLYDAGRVGRGQTVGIYELEPYSPSDIAAYQACYGIDVPVTGVDVDGGPSSSAQSGEADLDIEVVAGLSPGSSIVVYSGPNNNATGPLDTYDAMVDDDTAKVLTTSWGECEPLIGGAQQQTEESVFAEAVTQGQTFFAASGDSGSSDCADQGGTNELAVDDPSSQPDMTGVGGTSLTSATPDDPTESVWNDSAVGGGADGGGNSTTFEAPSWQQVPAARSAATSYQCGNDFDQQCREVPDVAASADPDFGDLIYFAGGWDVAGGTSMAAPLWAALVADTNQGCASPAGLLGPTIYASDASSSFDDITVGNNDLFGNASTYPAGVGYDLASGWGSPRGAALLGLLSGSASGCPTVTGLDPSSGWAVGGTTVVISGSGFGSGTPIVRIGGVRASVVSSSPTSITVTTPDVGTGRSAPVTVTTTGTAAGTNPTVAGSIFTYVSPEVTSVVDNRGPVGGGERVTISGSGFLAGSSVTFGGVAAVSRVVSPSTIVATVPAGPSQGGTVDVVVRAASGTSPTGPDDRYTYGVPGYWLTASDGGVFAFGDAGFYGSTGAMALNRPIVGMAATPDDSGYWLVASDGGVFAFGDAGFYGSTGGIALNKPIVGMVPTPGGGGYWLVASDGGIFAFGDAGFYGSTGGLTLNRPIVGMTSTPDGGGYWLVASDGGVFAFGDAGFYGSTGGIALDKPIVGMASTLDGNGYWMVASDGGIFAFGDAGFYGSTGGLVLDRPIVGMGVDLTGDGYWLVASDGGIFAFGDAPFDGSTGGTPLNEPIVGMSPT